MHKQAIDKKTFREHMDRLREQEAIAKLERYDAELEDLDVGAVLAFAERTLCDLAGSWNRAELQQKQRLQSISNDASPLVTPTMRSWNQFFAFIEAWDELRMAA